MILSRKNRKKAKHQQKRLQKHLGVIELELEVLPVVSRLVFAVTLTRDGECRQVSVGAAFGEDNLD